MVARRRSFVPDVGKKLKKVVEPRVLIFRASHGSREHAERLLDRLNKDSSIMQHITDKHIQRFAEMAPQSYTHFFVLDRIHQLDPERVAHNMRDEHVHALLASSKPPSMPGSRVSYEAVVASGWDEKYYHFVRKVFVDNPELGKRILDQVERIAKDPQNPAYSKVHYGTVLLDLRKDLERALRSGVDPKDESFRITDKRKRAIKELISHLDKKQLGKVEAMVKQLKESDEFKKGLRTKGALGTLSLTYE